MEVAKNLVIEALLQLCDDRASFLRRTIVGNCVSIAQIDVDHAGVGVASNLCTNHIQAERRANPTHPRVEHGARVNVEFLSLVFRDKMLLNPGHRCHQGGLPSCIELLLLDFFLKHTGEEVYHFVRLSLTNDHAATIALDIHSVGKASFSRQRPLLGYWCDKYISQTFP